MIEVVLFSIVLFSGFALLINYSYFKQAKNVYCQKVYFLNRELQDASSIKEYILKKQFSVAVDRFSGMGDPNIYSEFMENHFYRSAIEDYKERRKIFRVIRIIFGLTLVIAIIVLLTLYPEFIINMPNEDSYER